MKKAIVILCLSLFAVNAQAGFWDIVGGVVGAIADSGSSSGNGNSSSRGSYDSRDRHSRSRISCTYRDQGHEEHSRGHRSCDECQGKHGKCVEVCSTDFASCKVEGRDYRGYTMTVEAKADTQYEAEREAIYRCDRNGWTECRRLSCSNDSETVSRRSCRR